MQKQIIFFEYKVHFFRPQPAKAWTTRPCKGGESMAEHIEKVGRTQSG